jgi:hypothetical protein
MTLSTAPPATNAVVVEKAASGDLMPSRRHIIRTIAIPKMVSSVLPMA